MNNNFKKIRIKKRVLFCKLLSPFFFIPVEKNNFNYIIFVNYWNCH